MGHGSYSYEAHEAISKARTQLPRQEIFKQTSCHALMNPHGLKVRESRDSATHPESLGIFFALDVTGSMGSIPEMLARKELPTFMKTLLDCGVRDPQVLFLAVGDATCDKAPLQIGQFESAAKEMDQWLTWSFLEGGGGSQLTESYELAMYTAARHTAMDCFEKRKHRGYFVMTGDENPYPAVSKRQVEGLIGDVLPADLPVADVVKELQKTFEPFFLIPDQQRRTRCERTWRDLLGDHVICMEDPVDTCYVTSGLIGLCEGAIADLDALAARLRTAGLTDQRSSAVVRALTPLAAALQRDGTPRPAVQNAQLPAGQGGPSGLSRP
jgi:hypothetical protein